MASAIFIVCIALPLYWIYSNIIQLRKNIHAAKRSGLPYVIVPVSLYNPLWVLGHKVAFQILEFFPKSWTENWIEYLIPDFTWVNPRSPWDKMGDLFLTVSPGLTIVWIANAEAIHQITSRREDFPKPTASYKILEIFGRNIISTEGAEWKQHRKVTSPSFNEKNNLLVFAEACSQAQGMLRKWTGADGKGNTTVNDVPMDTDRLALHIISTIGFGKRLLWPGEERKEGESPKDVYSSESPADGHTMSFENALHTLLEQILWVLLTPTWLLKRIPLESAHDAYNAFMDWGQYMNELFSQKVQEAREGQHTRGMDIMGSLVKTRYHDQSKTGQYLGAKGQETGNSRGLSDSDILGNAFIMILAGHETTANSIHFTLTELAMNGIAQRQVQSEVQSIFGDTTPDMWNYDSSINRLLGGFVGGALNEQLRLMPPVTTIPKSISKTQEQVISVDGKTVRLPAGAHISLCTIGVHRNPKYWPSRPSAMSDRADDLDDFKPERWFIKNDVKQLDISEDSEDDEFGGFTGTASHSNLFRPVRGSYLPFSDGSRSCLGRRLAQVKIMASLAVIFQHYSIELAVDEWASDAEVLNMSKTEKKKLYLKATNKARATMRNATSIITLRLRNESVPIRMVRKGEERFINLAQ